MIRPAPRHWLAAGTLALAINALLLALLQQLSPTPGHRGGYARLAPVAIQAGPASPPAPTAPAAPALPSLTPPPPLTAAPPPATPAAATVPSLPSPAAVAGLPTDPAARMHLQLALPAAPSAGPTAAVDGYRPGEVDQPPQALYQPSPPYPLSARRQETTGEVLVRLRVTPAGRVDRVELVHADPPGVFDASVLRTVRRWRFRPGMLHGAAVPVWLELPVRFKLQP